MSDANGQALVRLEGVHRTFRMGEVQVRVLKGIDLEIRRGEITAIVGPSGCGKTTLLNLVGGIDRPTEGRIWFEDRDLTELDERALTFYRREQIGFVFQFYNLVPTLTALENVRVTTEISGDPMDPERALELVGLADKTGNFPSQLSGGEQQRASIARAVAGRPRLLLCDEPTGALDSETGRAVLGSLQRLNREEGLTITIITHNLAIAPMAHRTVHLHDGIIGEIETNASPASADEISW